MSEVPGMEGGVEGHTIPALLLPPGKKTGRTSNLAFALQFLCSAVRHDLLIYYAFCREVDDIADSTSLPADAKREKLREWRNALENRALLPTDFRDVLERHDIPSELPCALIDGCIADIELCEVGDFDELRNYCWQVAVSVGLAHNHIVGARDPASYAYAEALGIGLQLVNILRDVAEDAHLGRVYLPVDELRSRGIEKQELLAPVESPALVEYFDFFATRAASFLEQARAVLPAKHKRALRAAESMRRIYHALLMEIRSSGFAVLQKRIRISTPRKLWLCVAPEIIFRRVD